MPIARLVLALIALAPPQPAPVTTPAPAPTVAPAPVAAPAPALTPNPVPAPVGPAPAPPSVAPVPAPVVPPRTGLGLLVAGPLVVAVGVPFAFLGNKAWRANCGPNSSDRQCADGSFASAAGHTVAGMAFATGMSLTGVGGARRGRYDAGRNLAHDGVGFIASGAIVLPASLIGMGMVRLLMWLPTPDCETYDCVARLQTTSTASVGSLALAASIGAGLLMYGAAYKKNKRTMPPVALLPQVGRGFAGLNLTGQF